MKILTLSADNLDKLVEFEINARETEADIFVDEFVPAEFEKRMLDVLLNPLYKSAQCLLCADNNGKVIGRIDFALLPSYAFSGDLRAYIDWLYVLLPYRRKGVAHFLIEQAVLYLMQLGVSEYFLLAADNPDAQHFYRNLQHAKISTHDILTGGTYDTNG